MKFKGLLIVAGAFFAVTFLAVEPSLAAQDCAWITIDLNGTCDQSCTDQQKNLYCDEFYVPPGSFTPITSCYCADYACEPPAALHAQSCNASGLKLTKSLQQKLQQCSSVCTTEREQFYCYDTTQIANGNGGLPGCNCFTVSPGGEPVDTLASREGCTQEKIILKQAFSGRSQYTPIPVKETAVQECSNQLNGRPVDTKVSDSEGGFLWENVSLGCWKCGTCKIADFMQVMVNFITGSVGVIAALGLVYFVFGGVTMVTSAGNPEKVEHGKKIMVNTVLAIGAVALSWLLVNTLIMALSGGDTVFQKPWYFINVGL